jgi:hypothetical protein
MATLLNWLVEWPERVTSSVGISLPRKSSRPSFQVDSILTLVGFDESEYLALFLWLAIAGAGSVSVDRWMKRFTRPARE